MADAINNIGLITKFSTKGWDKVYKAEAMSSLLDAQEGLLQFTGAKTCKIAKVAFGRLHDYTRNSDQTGTAQLAVGDGTFGYQSSKAGLTWEDFTISQDRAAYYPIEYFDNEEAADLVLGSATTEVSRTVVVPEVDAYCFSTIASKASVGLKNLVDGVVSDNKFLAPINDAFLYFDNHEIPAEDQILFISPNYMNGLRNDTGELQRFLMQADYDKNVKFKLTEYEGRKIVVVPPARFKLGFVSDAEGYHFTGKDIDFLLMAKRAAVHVVKYNKVKILSGDLALAMTHMDGYVLCVRVYHDVFVADNQRVALYVHTGAFSTQVSIEPTVSVTISKAGKIAHIIVNPGDRLVSIISTTQTGLTAGGAYTYDSVKDTLVGVGSAVAIGATLYAIMGGKVLQVVTTVAE